jgi:hypothetical protein
MGLDIFSILPLSEELASEGEEAGCEQVGVAAAPARGPACTDCYALATCAARCMPPTPTRPRPPAPSCTIVAAAQGEEWESGYGSGHSWGRGEQVRGCTLRRRVLMRPGLCGATTASPSAGPVVTLSPRAQEPDPNYAPNDPDYDPANDSDNDHRGKQVSLHSKALTCTALRCESQPQRTLHSLTEALACPAPLPPTRQTRRHSPVSSMRKVSGSQAGASACLHPLFRRPHCRRCCSSPPLAAHCCHLLPLDAQEAQLAGQPQPAVEPDFFCDPRLLAAEGEEADSQQVGVAAG